MNEFGLMCVAALERMAYLDAARLRRTLRVVVPQSAVVVLDRGHGIEESGLLVCLDGHELAVVVVDGRLPEPEFSAALAPNVFWPNAAATMDRHQAFAVITAARPPAGPGEMRAQAAAQTRLAAVLAEMLPVLGFFWRGAAGPVAPLRVRQALGDLNQNKWPADLWIGYEFRGRDTDGGFFTGVRSKGAIPYLGAEVEVPPRSARDEADLLRYFYRAVGDLLSRGRKIRDGEPVRMIDPREAWHQVRYVSYGDVPVVTLRELEEPIWGIANVCS